MTRSLAFATDVALRTAEGSAAARSGDALVVRTPGNPAYRWGNFLLVPAAGDPAARVREHAAAFPGAGFTTVGVDDAHPALDEGAWRSAGFEVERLAVLTSHDPAPVPGTGVRPLASDDDWAAVTAIALELAEAPDEEHVAFTRRRTEDQRGLVERGRAVWLGAEVDGRVVATAGVAAALPGVARFQDVQTAVAHRRRGHASAVVAAGLRVAREDLACGTAVIVADRAGPAIGLYRRLGFREVETQLQLSRVDAPDARIEDAVGGPA